MTSNSVQAGGTAMSDAVEFVQDEHNARLYHLRFTPKRLEYLDAAWKRQGVPDAERAARLERERRRWVHGAETVEDGVRALATDFAARGIPADVTTASARTLVGNAPLDAPLASVKSLESVVQAVARATASTQHRRDPLATGTTPLAFRDALDLLDEPEAHEEWLWHGFLAPGLVTLLYGKPKGGKSTMTFDLLRGLQDGGEFLGRPLKPTKIVFLSEEEPRSLKQKIARFGIPRGLIRLVSRRDAYPGRPLAELLAAAAEQARSFGAGLIVVDTVTFWADLEKDAEKDSGVVTRIARLLQETAIKANAAVLAIHHDKKGNEVGLDAIRGSSAWAGNADLIVQFREPREGEPERELRGWGRYEETPRGLRVTYADGRYQLVGALEDRSPAKRKESLVAHLPATEPGLTVREAATKTGVGERAARKMLDQAGRDALVLKTGAGTRANPWRYYRDPAAAEFGG